MFDIGFMELVFIGIISLLVLGPERLPKAARAAGKWVGKARRMVGEFSREIDRQVEAEELREMLKKQGESLNINEDVRNIQKTVQSALDEARIDQQASDDRAGHDFEPLPRELKDEPPRTIHQPEQPPQSTDSSTVSADLPSKQEQAK